MAFHANRVSLEESNVPQGSIGSKINKFRELKNLSQKELGILCGFKESGADARIVQYEKLKRTPNKETIENIANALGISKYALYDTDLSSVDQMIHILFDLGNLHGLVPVLVNDKIYLSFEDDREDYKEKIQPFLQAWYDARLKLDESMANASPEEENEIRNDYILWCAEYPYGEKTQFGNYRDLKKMEELQQEMDFLNAKIHSPEERRKINQAVDKMKPLVLKEYNPTNKASDFCLILLEALESGVIIDWRPTSEVLIDSDDILKCLEFSFKTDNILSSQETKKSFTKIVCALETLKQYDIVVSDTIVSIKNDLWIDYYCHYSNGGDKIFDFVRDVWEDMLTLVEIKNDKTVSDSEKEKKEQEFKKKITGDNDLILSKPFVF